MDARHVDETIEAWQLNPVPEEDEEDDDEYDSEAGDSVDGDMTFLTGVGIEERRVRLAEAQGSLMNDVIRRILARLSLNTDQSALLPVVVPEELRRAAAFASAN
jgi:hypothetical protein